MTRFSRSCAGPCSRNRARHVGAFFPAARRRPRDAKCRFTREMGLEPATSGVTGRRRYSTSLDGVRHVDVTRPGSTTPDSSRRVRSHRARTAVVSFGTAERRVPANRLFLAMERAGFEPAASDLQTHPIARLHLTRADRIGMTEPKSAVRPNVARHRSTAVRSHRARTIAA